MSRNRTKVMGHFLCFLCYFENFTTAKYGLNFWAVSSQCFKARQNWFCFPDQSTPNWDSSDFGDIDKNEKS